MSLFGGAPAQSQSSLFNSQQSAPPLFGAPASSNSLFGAPASSASLFGAPASSASLFGAPASSGGLFGAPASSGGLFGAPASSSALFGTPASSASLFGGPASSASLFGAPPASSSLFGAPASSASLFGAPASSASLFGAPPNSSSLFGAPASAPSLFGGAPQSASLFASSGSFPGASPPSQPLSQAPNSEYPGHTKINQLPENLKAELFAVERHLRDQRSKFNVLWSERNDVDTSLQSVSTSTEMLARSVSKLNAEVDAMHTSVDVLRSAVATERASAEPVLTAFDNLCKTALATSSVFSTFNDAFQMHDGRLVRAAHVPDEYFQRIVSELEARAHSYKAEIDEIAQFLRAHGVPLGNSSNAMFGKSRARRLHGSSMGYLGANSALDSTGSTNTAPESYGKTIEDIIKRQYEYLMTVASQIATVNEQLRTVKEAFLGVLAARDGDMSVNPFEQADLREKADKDRQRLLVERSVSNEQVPINTNTVSVNPTPTQQLLAPPAQNTSQVPTNANNVILTTGALTAPRGGDAPRGKVRTSLDGVRDSGGSSLAKRMSDGRRRI